MSEDHDFTDADGRAAYFSPGETEGETEVTEIANQPEIVMETSELQKLYTFPEQDDEVEDADDDD